MIFVQKETDFLEKKKKEGDNSMKKRKSAQKKKTSIKITNKRIKLFFPFVDKQQLKSKPVRIKL